MSGKLLLTGIGGQYTSEAFTTAGSPGADTIDASHCAQLSLQCEVVGSPGGTYAIEQSFDAGKNWKALVPAAPVGAGNVQLVGPTAGPFGVIRVNPASVTGLSSTVTVQIIITGFALPAWE